MEEPPAVYNNKPTPPEISSMTIDGDRPPPSPLSGGYLLIVIGEPQIETHKPIILQKLAKAFLSWDSNESGIDIERELAIVTALSPEGDLAKNGERLIQYASEHLVTEILIHPQINTLRQCIRNLLSSFTKYRFIIHAGYVFCGNGSWVLQDGTFSMADFIDAFHEIEVQRVIKAYERTVKVDICCIAEGNWNQECINQEAFSKICRIELNPSDKIPPGTVAVREFIQYLEPFMNAYNICELLESSEVVGNIRFSRPTLYVFPGGDGDAALFGINGFNMLVDGGFNRRACFWNFVRHLDRLDAVLLTRINNSNIGGMAGIVQRKVESHVYPQIGHFFSNLQEKKALASPDGDKDREPLLVNLIEEGNRLVLNLKKLQLKPHHCYRDQNPDPINLYHKVGHGKLDMYVISPARDSREVKEFLSRWNNHDIKLFGGTSKTGNRELRVPLQNLVSICALLVWQPANPEDHVTRILFPGSAPQHKIFEGIERIKPMEFLKHSSCLMKSIQPIQTTTKSAKYKISSTTDEKFSHVIPASQKIIPDDIKNTIKSTIDGLAENEATELKKTIPADIKSEPQSIKRKPIEKAPTKEIKIKTETTKELTLSVEKQEKIPQTETDDSESKKVEVTKTKSDMKKAEKKIIRATERKNKPIVNAEKKSESDKSSPTTPKKTILSTKEATTNKGISKSTFVSNRTRTPPKMLPGKRLKDESNRKVAETKQQSRVIPPKITTTTTTNTPSNSSTTNTVTVAPTSTPITKYIKKEVTKLKAAPTKSEKQKTTSAATPTIKAVKRPPSKPDDLKKTLKSDEKTDSSAVSTPSTLDVDLTASKVSINNKQNAASSTETVSSSPVINALSKEIHALLPKQQQIQKETDGIESAVEDADSAIYVSNIIRKEGEDEEDEILIIETTEIERVIDDEEQKYMRDEKESEKGEKKLEADESAKLQKEKLEQISIVKIDEDGEKQKKLDLDTLSKHEVVKSTLEMTPEEKDIIFDQVEGIIMTATEIISTTAGVQKNIIDAIEVRNEKSEAETQIEKVGVEKQAESNISGGKMTETSSKTPTLPEDEKIDEAQHEIEEKYDKEETKEKYIYKLETKIPTDTPLPSKQLWPTENINKQKLEDFPDLHKKELVKTPDEVADLPLHEEVDASEYETQEHTNKVTSEKPVIDIVSVQLPEFVHITPTSSPDEKTPAYLKTKTVTGPDEIQEAIENDSTDISTNTVKTVSIQPKECVELNVPLKEATSKDLKGTVPINPTTTIDETKHIMLDTKDTSSVTGIDISPDQKEVSEEWKAVTHISSKEAADQTKSTTSFKDTYQITDAAITSDQKSPIQIGSSTTILHDLEEVSATIPTTDIQEKHTDIITSISSDRKTSTEVSTITSQSNAVVSDDSKSIPVIIPRSDAADETEVNAPSVIPSLKSVTVSHTEIARSFDDEKHLSDKIQEILPSAETGHQEQKQSNMSLLDDEDTRTEKKSDESQSDQILTLKQQDEKQLSTRKLTETKINQRTEISHKQTPVQLTGGEEGKFGTGNEKTEITLPNSQVTLSKIDTEKKTKHKIDTRTSSPDFSTSSEQILSTTENNVVTVSPINGERDKHTELSNLLEEEYHTEITIIEQAEEHTQLGNIKQKVSVDFTLSPVSEHIQIQEQTKLPYVADMSTVDGIQAETRSKITVQSQLETKLASETEMNFVDKTPMFTEINDKQQEELLNTETKAPAQKEEAMDVSKESFTTQENNILSNEMKTRESPKTEYIKEQDIKIKGISSILDETTDYSYNIETIRQGTNKLQDKNQSLPQELKDEKVSVDFTLSPVSEHTQIQEQTKLPYVADMSTVDGIQAETPSKITVQSQLETKLASETEMNFVDKKEMLSDKQESMLQEKSNLIKESSSTFKELKRSEDENEHTSDHILHSVNEEIILKTEHKIAKKTSFTSEEGISKLVNSELTEGKEFITEILDKNSPILQVVETISTIPKVTEKKSSIVHEKSDSKHRKESISKATDKKLSILESEDLAKKVTESISKEFDRKKSDSEIIGRIEFTSKEEEIKTSTAKSTETAVSELKSRSTFPKLADTEQPCKYEKSDSTNKVEYISKELDKGLLTSQKLSETDHFSRKLTDLKAADEKSLIMLEEDSTEDRGRRESISKISEKKLSFSEETDRKESISEISESKLPNFEATSRKSLSIDVEDNIPDGTEVTLREFDEKSSSILQKTEEKLVSKDHVRKLSISEVGNMGSNICDRKESILKGLKEEKLIFQAAEKELSVSNEECNTDDRKESMSTIPDEDISIVEITDRKSSITKELSPKESEPKQSISTEMKRKPSILETIDKQSSIIDPEESISRDGEKAVLREKQRKSPTAPEVIDIMNRRESIIKTETPEDKILSITEETVKRLSISCHIQDLQGTSESISKIAGTENKRSSSISMEESKSEDGRSFISEEKYKWSSTAVTDKIDLNDEKALISKTIQNTADNGHNDISGRKNFEDDEAISSEAFIKSLNEQIIEEKSSLKTPDEVKVLEKSSSISDVNDEKSIISHAEMVAEKKNESIFKGQKENEDKQETNLKGKVDFTDTQLFVSNTTEQSEQKKHEAVKECYMETHGDGIVSRTSEKKDLPEEKTLLFDHLKQPPHETIIKSKKNKQKTSQLNKNELEEFGKSDPSTSKTEQKYENEKPSTIGEETKQSEEISLPLSEKFVELENKPDAGSLPMEFQTSSDKLPIKKDEKKPKLEIEDINTQKSYHEMQSSLDKKLSGDFEISEYKNTFTENLQISHKTEECCSDSNGSISIERKPIEKSPSTYDIKNKIQADEIPTSEVVKNSTSEDSEDAVFTIQQLTRQLSRQLSKDKISTPEPIGIESVCSKDVTETQPPISDTIQKTESRSIQNVEQEKCSTSQFRNEQFTLSQKSIEEISPSREVSISQEVSNRKSSSSQDNSPCTLTEGMSEKNTSVTVKGKELTKEMSLTQDSEIQKLMSPDMHEHKEKEIFTQEQRKQSFQEITSASDNLVNEKPSTQELENRRKSIAREISETSDRKSSISEEVQKQLEKTSTTYKEVEISVARESPFTERIKETFCPRTSITMTEDAKLSITPEIKNPTVRQFSTSEIKGKLMDSEDIIISEEMKESKVNIAEVTDKKTPIIELDAGDISSVMDVKHKPSIEGEQQQSVKRKSSISETEKSSRKFTEEIQITDTKNQQTLEMNQPLIENKTPILERFQLSDEKSQASGQSDTSLKSGDASIVVHRSSISEKTALMGTEINVQKNLDTKVDIPKEVKCAYKTPSTPQNSEDIPEISLTSSAASRRTSIKDQIRVDFEEYNSNLKTMTASPTQYDDVTSAECSVTFKKNEDKDNLSNMATSIINKEQTEHELTTKRTPSEDSYLSSHQSIETVILEDNNKAKSTHREYTTSEPHFIERDLKDLQKESSSSYIDDKCSLKHKKPSANGQDVRSPSSSFETFQVESETIIKKQTELKTEFSPLSQQLKLMESARDSVVVTESSKEDEKVNTENTSTERKSVTHQSETGTQIIGVTEVEVHQSQDKDPILLKRDSTEINAQQPNLQEHVITKSQTDFIIEQQHAGLNLISGRHDFTPKDTEICRLPDELSSEQNRERQLSDAKNKESKTVPEVVQEIRSPVDISSEELLVIDRKLSGLSPSQSESTVLSEVNKDQVNIKNAVSKQDDFNNVLQEIVSTEKSISEKGKNEIKDFQPVTNILEKHEKIEKTSEFTDNYNKCQLSTTMKEETQKQAKTKTEEEETSFNVKHRESEVKINYAIEDTINMTEKKHSFSSVTEDKKTTLFQSDNAMTIDEQEFIKVITDRELIQDPHQSITTTSLAKFSEDKNNIKDIDKDKSKGESFLHGIHSEHPITNKLSTDSVLTETTVTFSSESHEPSLRSIESQDNKAGDITYSVNHASNSTLTEFQSNETNNDTKTDYQFHTINQTSCSTSTDFLPTERTTESMSTDPVSPALQLDAIQMCVKFTSNNISNKIDDSEKKKSPSIMKSNSEECKTVAETTSDTIGDLSTKFEKRETISKTVSLPILGDTRQRQEEISMHPEVDTIDVDSDFSKSYPCLDRISHTDSRTPTNLSDTAFSTQHSEVELQSKSVSLPVIKRPDESERYMTLPNLYKTSNLEDLTTTVTKDINSPSLEKSIEDVSIDNPPADARVYETINFVTIDPIKETDESSEEEFQNKIIESNTESNQAVLTHSEYTKISSQTHVEKDFQTKEHWSDTANSKQSYKDENIPISRCIRNTSTTSSNVFPDAESSHYHKESELTNLYQKTDTPTSEIPAVMMQSCYGSFPSEDVSDEHQAETVTTSSSTPVTPMSEFSVHQKHEETKMKESKDTLFTDDTKKDPISDWGKPLGLPSAKNNDINTLLIWNPLEQWGKPFGLPSPGPLPSAPTIPQHRNSNGDIELNLTPLNSKGTPKKSVKKTVTDRTSAGRESSKTRDPSVKKIKSIKSINPIYVDLAYVPHHGNPNYTTIEFFKRIRARYYVFSSTDSSKDVYNALLDAKKSWENPDLEVTIIPTYDTDALGYWITENEEELTHLKIDLAPSASRCTINLQDHDTSCSAYRLEF